MENPANPPQDEQNPNQNRRRRQGVIPEDNSIKDAINTAKKVFKVARQVGSILSNPAFLIPIIIIIIILIVFFFGASAAPMGGGGDATPTPPAGGGANTGPPPIPGLTVTLIGPKAIENGGDIIYKVSVAYDSTTAKTPIENIELYDTIPEGTTFAGTTGTAASNSSPSIATWDLKDTANQQPFTFTLHTNTNDTNITNSVFARLIAGTGTGNTQPTADNCNGYYDLTKPPQGLNFGDPSCTLLGNQDRIYTLLKQLDPANTNNWYLIAQCESGYNANAYNGNSESGLGAYGLFQMNPSGRGSGPLDAGNVGWETQTSNAISYNKEAISGSFRYWDCARQIGLW